MEKGAQTRLTTALVLAVVLAAGMVLGVAVDRSLVPEVEATEASAEEEARPRRTPMYEQVGPSEAQRVKIDSIVHAHRQAMRELQKEFRDAYDPRYRALIEEARQSIRDVFDADQAAAYDSLIAEYDRNRAERGSRENRE